MPDWPFVPGKQYTRRDIHADYGGQQNGGIATPVDHPVIFIFTGAAGKQFGYEDKRHPDGSLTFYGEGQSGDMRMVRGNKAIATHVAAGKDILVFEALGKGKPVRFLGQFICNDISRVAANDSDGFEREAIVFSLTPAATGDAAELPEPVVPADMEEFRRLRERAYSAARKPDKTTKTQTVCERSAVIRDYALARASGSCENCCQTGPFLDKLGRPFLEVHHLRRLTDGGPDSPSGVAAICPNCHREIHHGVGGKEKNAILLATIRELEKRTYRDLFPETPTKPQN